MDFGLKLDSVIVNRKENCLVCDEQNQVSQVVPNVYESIYLTDS